MTFNEVKLEHLTGFFTYCIYKNFNYAVYRFNDLDDGVIIVTGNLGEVEMDTKYELCGTFVNHPKFGFQFNVCSYQKCLPNNLEGIVAYLSSDLFKGIGKKKALKIVDHFKEDSLNILKNNPERIDEVELSSKDKMTIIQVIKSDLLYEENFYYLINFGFSIKDTNLILNTYKEATIKLISANPYLAYYDIYGIGFKKVDNLALKNGYDHRFDERLVALITHLIDDLSFRSGNTYFSYEELAAAFIKIEKRELFEPALNLALEREKIIVDDGRYYHFNQYRAEKGIANFLHRLIVYNDSDFDESALDSVLNTLQTGIGINYDDEQLKAIKAFYANRFSLVLGGPGTGKTTIVKALVESVKKLYPLSELHIVAPTGRAAKRISELCDVNSSTIHSLLKWDKDTNTFTYGSDNPLLLDILVIDEFSMVDNVLFYRLISALGNVKKICIIGDHNQLPSVASGNLLFDLIHCNLFHVTYLKRIFRQSQGSDIITLANDVLQRHVDFMRYPNDVYFIDDESNDCKNTILKMIRTFMTQGYNLNDIQVLSPMYKGSLGIVAINELLQDIFNPRSVLRKEYRQKYRLFRENDKILQLKNQSSNDVFNGDIGFIDTIQTNDNRLSLIGRFDDIFVEYNDDDLSNLALAYCISVHKSQGSEYPIVFLLVSKEHQRMLYRKLLYTACSRAADKLIIVGNKEVFYRGILQDVQSRKTSLCTYLLALQGDSDLL